MRKSTSKSNPGKPEKSGKPHPDFPLCRHSRGYWCKKVKGKLHYFGKVAEDPNGQKALERWLAEKDNLLAGRKPPPRQPVPAQTRRELREPSERCHLCKGWRAENHAFPLILAVRTSSDFPPCPAQKGSSSPRWPNFLGLQLVNKCAIKGDGELCSPRVRYGGDN